MTLEVLPCCPKWTVLSPKRPSWTPLPYEGCINVYAKSLLSLEHLGIAMLRFEKEATIHEHPADMEIDVICLEGAGFTSVSGKQAPLKAGERVRWPAGQPHRLWTTDSEMITLMVEHPKSTEPEWEYADSSMITVHKYDPAKQELDVVFNRKSTYRYFDVPLELIEKFRTADSKGRFLQQEIIDKFEYKKLEQ